MATSRQRSSNSTKQQRKNDKTVEAVRSRRERICTTRARYDSSQHFKHSNGSAKLPPGGALRILDYGGASGAHYDLARTVPALSINKYIIAESPAVARALHPFGSATLEWVSSAQSPLPAAVGPIDLVLSSSTIQYVPNPIGLLAEFAAVSQFLILDRIPLIARDAHTVMKQHTRYDGKAVTYPTWVFSEHAFLSELAELGYEIILQWEVPEDRPVLDGRRRPNVGMLLQR